MNLGIQGKRALVTGAGRGLGRSIASCLAREGAKVVVLSHTASDLATLVAKMGGETAGHLGFPLDLSLQSASSNLLEKLEETGVDRVDIVVHNVGGTLSVTDPFCPIDEWRRVWRLNLEVAVELNRVLVPRMQARRWGRVVHVASISALENHGPIPYCSVKAALTAYARSLGRFVAPDGVVVTTVLPGAVFTEGGYWDRAAREQPAHVEKYLSERMAIRRFGDPSEVGEVVAFLCSEHASFCTGSAVPVDGGQGRGYFGQ